MPRFFSTPNLTAHHAVCQLFTCSTVHVLLVNGFVVIVLLYVAYELVNECVELKFLLLELVPSSTHRLILVVLLVPSLFATTYKVTESITAPLGTAAFVTLKVCLLVVLD